MKIALNMIIKGNENPAKLIKMLGSVAPYMDGLYITTTQERKKETTEVLESYGVILSHFDWTDNFSEARNYALQQVPDEYEYIFWIDDDDVVLGAEHIKAYLQMDYDCYYMNYLYLVDPKTQRVIQQHPRERIVRKKLYKWGANELPVGSLHECLTPQIDNPKSMYVDKVVIKHTMTLNDGETETKHQRNHRILLKSYELEGSEHDPRTEFYLARSYIENKEDTLAEKLLWDYVSHSGWDEERAVAFQYLGEIYYRAKQYEEAIQCYEASIRERHDFPWVYFRLGQTYAEMGNWERCLFYTKIGLDLPYPKTGMPTNPLHDKSLAMVNLYEAFLGMRKLKLALGSVNKLLELHPESEFWREKEQFLLEAIKEGELVKHTVDIVQELKDGNENEKAQVLLNVLPKTITDNGLIWSLRHEVGKPYTWGEKEIVYFTGQGAETWDDTSLNKGVGGSETAVIHLTQWWRKHGYNVTVYGDPFEEHIDKYGVFWKPWWKFNYNDEFNILVAWRTTAYAKVKAKKLFVDFHDMVNRMRFDKDIVDNVTAFMCKSSYQKSFMPEYAQKKAHVVSNGFDKSLLVQKQKDKNKIIYTSSYDRGLYEMLKYGWSIIKKDCPDAVLHTYYGWNIFDKFFKNDKSQQRWKNKMVELMNACGVIDHGRISQKELMEERATASVHWYATTFQEIDCISIRESAASSVVPVVTNHAVFTNNERPYTIVVPGNPWDKRTHEDAARKVVEVLQGKHEEKREQFKRLAIHEDWENIALQWEKLFI